MVHEGLALAHLGVGFEEEEITLALVARVEVFAFVGPFFFDSKVEGGFAGSAVACE